MNNSTTVTNYSYNIVDMCYAMCIGIVSIMLFLYTLYYVGLKLLGEI
jgi:hypothetical protein